MAHAPELTAACTRCGGPPTEGQRYPDGNCGACCEAVQRTRQTIGMPNPAAQPLPVVSAKVALRTLYGTSRRARRVRRTRPHVHRQQRRGSNPARRVARRAARSCSRAAGGGSGEPGEPGPHDLAGRDAPKGVTA